MNMSVGKCETDIFCQCTILVFICEANNIHSLSSIAQAAVHPLNLCPCIKQSTDTIAHCNILEQLDALAAPYTRIPVLLKQLRQFDNCPLQHLGRARCIGSSIHSHSCIAQAVATRLLCMAYHSLLTWCQSRSGFHDIWFRVALCNIFPCTVLR